MPNIRRTFPTKPDAKPSSSDEDDDDDDDDDDTNNANDVEQQVAAYRMPAGKQLRPMGGKHMGGKQLGGATYGDDDDDDDDDDDSEEEEPQQYVNRGSGKQLRASGGGGKYLRPPPQDGEDDDDSDEDELEDESEEEAVEPVRVVQRGGGKSMIRYRAQQDDDEESEEEPEPAPAPIRVMPRSGGKSLSRMAPPPDSDDEEEEEADNDVIDVDEEPVKPVQRSAVYGSPAGGKQLRRPEPEGEPVPPKASIARPAPQARGKQLRRPEPEDEEPVAPAATSISRSPAGGKQLRRAEEEEEPAPAKTSISRSPAGGKQLRRADAEEMEEEKPKSTISRSPAGGKQLRRPATKEESDEDDDELELDSDGDDDEDDAYEESFVPKPKGRPSRAAASKRKGQVVESSEEEDFLDDDVSSDEEEQELDINNTEALIQNEEDRKYLDSLPELEREAIMGERYEKLKAEQDMKKAIREAKRKETEKAAKAKPPAKRKTAPSKGSAKKAKTESDAALAKSLASKRESARDRDAKGVKSKKAAALAALRKERKVQQEQDDSDDSELDFGDDDEDSDDDYEEAMPWQKKGKAAKSTVSRLDQVDESDDDMEIDDDDEPRKKSGRVSTDRTSKIVKDADLEDFKKVVIPRRRLARWCAEPFFEAAVLECFVRLFIGEDNNGEKVYRICEITDIKPGSKTYKFPVSQKHEKPISTNKVLNLKFGKHDRDFPMYLVSDEAPKEKDVRQYISVQKNLRAEVLSKRRAIKLRRLQDDLVNNYRYTKEDIERNLETRKKEGKSAANLGSELTRVTIAVQGAKHSIEETERKLGEAKRISLEYSGHNEKEELELSNNVKDAERALDDAKAGLEKRVEDERNTIAAVEDRKRRLTKRSKDINWAKVNQRALEANQKVDREANKVQEVSAAGKKTEFNPYARRKVRPKILWKVGQTEPEDKDDEAAVGEEKKESREEIAKDDKAMEDTPGLIPELNEKDAGLNENHQFAIDEEVLAGRGAGSKNRVTKQRIRKGLSLSDYLERKASGSL